MRASEKLAVISIVLYCKLYAGQRRARQCAWSVSSKPNFKKAPTHSRSSSSTMKPNELSPRPRFAARLGTRARFDLSTQYANLHPSQSCARAQHPLENHLIVGCHIGQPAAASFAMKRNEQCSSAPVAELELSHSSADKYQTDSHLEIVHFATCRQSCCRCCATI